MNLKKHPCAVALIAALTTTLYGCNDVIESSGTAVEEPAPTPAPEPAAPQTPEEAGWELVWADEFDADTLDDASWNALVGDGTEYGIPGWGNNELQYYEADNAFLQDGKLIIQAESDSVGGYNYTSARLTTEGKVDVTFGRIEASIKLPAGQGTWPAFWLLPTNSPYGAWAAGGEIDILEATNLGVDGKNEILGTIHYGSLWPLNRYSSDTYTPSEIVSDDFHRYAIEWEAGEIRWYIDDTHYATMTNDNWFSYYWGGQDTGFTTNENAPFNTPFHIILNVAIGGNLPGAPSNDLALPLQMEVDYVRVYQCPADSETGRGCASNLSDAADVPASTVYSEEEHTLFADGIGALTWQGTETQTRVLGMNSWWNNDGALTFDTPDIGGDQGTVLEIITTNSGNVSIYADDAETFELYGVGTSAEPWAPHNGELSFDLYVDSASTDPEGMIAIKMDSGFPNLGYINLPVSELTMDAWQPIHLKLSDLLANPNNGGGNPLDVNSVVSLFVVEPTSSAHIMLDNIKFKCGAPGNNSCGIRPPAPLVSQEELNVFVDSVDEAWTRGIGAWDSRAGFDYFDGTVDGNKVNWQTVDLDGNTVLEVSFDADASVNGVFYIQSLATIDLSAYTNGYVSFDIRVTDYGTNTTGMAMKIDCFFPCTSGDQSLGVVGDGNWETVNVPVQQLIDGGLDVTKVNTGIVIFPAPDDQGGVTFQLDNIVWTAGEPVEPEDPVDPTPTPSGDLLIFNGTDTPDPMFTPTLNGVTETLLEDEDTSYGTVAEYAFNINQTNLAYFVQPAGSTIDLSAYSTGTIEFDVKLIAEPDVGLANTNFYVKFDSVYPSTSSSFPIDPPELGVWKRYVISVADLLANPTPSWEQPANINGVDAAFVIAPDWGTEQGTVIRIDNIVWKQ